MENFYLSWEKFEAARAGKKGVDMDRRALAGVWESASKAPWRDEALSVDPKSLAQARGCRDGRDPYAEFKLGLLAHCAGLLEEASLAFAASREMSSGVDEGHEQAAMLGQAACLVEMGRCAEAREIVDELDPLAGMWLGRLLTAKTLRMEIDQRLKM